MRSLLTKKNIEKSLSQTLESHILLIHLKIALLTIFVVKRVTCFVIFGGQKLTEQQNSLILLSIKFADVFHKLDVTIIINSPKLYIPIQLTNLLI